MIMSYCWTSIRSPVSLVNLPGSGDTIEFGFKPKIWIVKEKDTTPWYIFDSERDYFDDPLFIALVETLVDGDSWNDTSVSTVSGSFNSVLTSAD